MFVNQLRRGIPLAAASAVLFGFGSTNASAQAVNYGKVGEPVKLVIGSTILHRSMVWSGHAR